MMKSWKKFLPDQILMGKFIKKEKKLKFYQKHEERLFLWKNYNNFIFNKFLF